MPSPAGAPPRWLAICQRFLQWGGAWGGTLVLTLIATGLSTVYSALLILWLEPTTFARMLSVGVVVPILLTPPLAFIVVTLLNALSSAHETVRLLADRDVLTDAYTRRYFLSKVNDRLARSRQRDVVDSIVLLDIDDFKRINDRHGHPTGDAVLRAISDTCRATLRDQDIFARYGGEEFVLLIEDVTPQQALDVVERTRVAIHGIRVIAPGGQPITVSASFGIAGSDLPAPIQPRPNTTLLEQILAAADRALYDAKHSGKDRAMLAGEASAVATA